MAVKEGRNTLVSLWFQAVPESLPPRRYLSVLVPVVPGPSESGMTNGFLLLSF